MMSTYLLTRLLTYLYTVTTTWKVLWESTTPYESEIWEFLSPTLVNTCHTYY